MVMKLQKTGLWAALPLVCTVFEQPVAAVTNPITSTANGLVQGVLSEYVPAVNVFKGIRFANSTAGANRWTHPPHPFKYTGIFNASTFGNECPQMGSPGTSGIFGDEDCLFLNIWTPENFSNSSNYPVFFWIYGGRFSGGAASDSTYDGSGLAKKGIVVVAPNYRLGALGYLAHPTLSAESGFNASGNYGLEDQQAALHWTNENIQFFGGNASQITLGGQSAGAASVLDQVYSPLAAGLFRGAIAESGARAPHDPLTGSLASSHRVKDVAEEQGIAYLKSLGVSTISEARNLPVDVLVTTGSVDDTTFVGTPFLNNPAYLEPPLFRPVTDGYVLPTTYAASLANNSHNDVAIMTGNNRDESGASPDPGISIGTYQANNSAVFAPISLAKRFFQLFPAHNTDQANIATDNLYRNQSLVSTWLWADAWAAGGAKNNVYTYYWTHAPPGQANGAFHGSEINYAFNNLYGTDLMGAHLNYTSADQTIANVMSSYWANFIRTGNPNGANLTQWLPSSNSSKKTMMLGDGYGMVKVASDSVIQFFEQFFAGEAAY